MYICMGGDPKGRYKGGRRMRERAVLLGAAMGGESAIKRMRARAEAIRINKACRGGGGGIKIGREMGQIGNLWTGAFWMNHGCSFISYI